MSINLLDTDQILAENEEWVRLGELWGNPIDLETEEDLAPSKLKPVLSTLNLKKSTFNSSFLFKKKLAPVNKKTSEDADSLSYEDFLGDLDQFVPSGKPVKQFYFVNGEILSAMSVEDICNEIDNFFNCLDATCVKTSTIREKKTPKKDKKKIPDFGECSTPVGVLSFDETVQSKKNNILKRDTSIEDFIDKAFEQINLLSDSVSDAKHSTRNTVTELVRKFKSMFEEPAVKCNPRRKRQCANNFKELTEFWKNLKNV
ncbi:uncharacterized protein ACR2FA_004640 [Aphomia sociella]